SDQVGTSSRSATGSNRDIAARSSIARCQSSGARSISSTISISNASRNCTAKPTSSLWITRHEAPVPPLVGHSREGPPLVPVDLARQFVVVFRAAVDLHAEAAVDQPADAAAQGPERLEIGGNALSGLPGDRCRSDQLPDGNALQPASENLRTWHA